MHRKIILAASLVFLCAFSTFAHDPGLSSAKLIFQNGILRAVLTFAPADIEAISESAHPSIAELNSVATQSLGIWMNGALQHPASAKVACLENKDVEFDLTFEAVPAGHLKARSLLLNRLPFGHRQYFTISNGQGTTVAEKLLKNAEETVEADFTEIPVSAAAATVVATPSHPFSEFLMMGVKHILTGYDHLLFLFALLIVCKRFGSVFKVITAFTVAHSISLALATLGWVEIPSRIVEPMIAASIVYVSIENLVRGQASSHRVLLTFCFGLVHGFGFASALREMGVGTSGGAIAVPLLAFNSGVELGQIAVAAVILPILWQLKDRPSFTLRWAPACSVTVALAGGFWFVQRVCGG